MVNTQTSSTKKLMAAAFAGAVALALMVPGQSAFAEDSLESEAAADQPTAALVDVQDAQMTQSSENATVESAAPAASEAMAQDDAPAAAESNSDTASNAGAVEEATDSTPAPEVASAEEPGIAAEAEVAGEPAAESAPPVESEATAAAPMININDQDYDGTANASGKGWSYEAEGQKLTLEDCIAKAINATRQNLHIILKGDSTVENIMVTKGNLTITGDDTVYGLDKPSLSLIGIDLGDQERVGGIEVDGKLDIADANIYGEANDLAAFLATDDISIVNSGIYRGKDNGDFQIFGLGKNTLLKGSEVQVTGILAGGKLTIDNTNLTVEQSSLVKKAIEEGTYTDKWIEEAVWAQDGIKLIGESNGVVKETKNADGKVTGYYLTTGQDDVIKLIATERPAYYGPIAKATKATSPKTGDATMPLILSLGMMAAFAAALSVYSTRQRKHEK